MACLVKLPSALVRRAAATASRYLAGSGGSWYHCFSLTLLDMKTQLLLLAPFLLPLAACAQSVGSGTAALPAAAPAVAAPAALPPAATDRRHYWADIEVGRSTLGSLALGADLHGEGPRHWLLTAGVHDESSTFLFDGHSGQQYELLTYQALAGKIVKGHACLLTVSAGLALLRTHSYVDKSLFTPITNDQRQATVGVPVQVQGYLVALQKLGLGFTATLNLNSVQTSASLGLALAVGRLPTRRSPLP